MSFQKAAADNNVTVYIDFVDKLAVGERIAAVDLADIFYGTNGISTPIDLTDATAIKLTVITPTGNTVYSHQLSDAVNGYFRASQGAWEAVEDLKVANSEGVLPSKPTVVGFKVAAGGEVGIYTIRIIITGEHGASWEKQDTLTIY